MCVHMFLCVEWKHLQRETYLVSAIPTQLRKQDLVERIHFWVRDTGLKLGPIHVYECAFKNVIKFLAFKKGRGSPVPWQHYPSVNPHNRMLPSLLTTLSFLIALVKQPSPPDYSCGSTAKWWLQGFTCKSPGHVTPSSILGQGDFVLYILSLWGQRHV